MSNKEQLAHVATERLLEGVRLTQEMAVLVRKQADTLDKLAKCLQQEADRRSRQKD